MSLTPYGHYSDEELLQVVYQTVELRNALELELATRLVHALDELALPAPNLESLMYLAVPPDGTDP